MCSIRVSLLLGCALGTFSSSRAALYDRGGGLICDDVLDVTWLQRADVAPLLGGTPFPDGVVDTADAH